jgi:hypothetical protein
MGYKLRKGESNMGIFSSNMFAVEAGKYEAVFEGGRRPVVAFDEFGNAYILPTPTKKRVPGLTRAKDFGNFIRVQEVPSLKAFVPCNPHWYEAVFTDGENEVREMVVGFMESKYGDEDGRDWEPAVVRAPDEEDIRDGTFQAIHITPTQYIEYAKYIDDRKLWLVGIVPKGQEEVPGCI